MRKFRAANLALRKAWWSGKISPKTPPEKNIWWKSRFEVLTAKHLPFNQIAHNNSEGGKMAKKNKPARSLMEQVADLDDVAPKGTAVSYQLPIQFEGY